MMKKYKIIEINEEYLKNLKEKYKATYNTKIIDLVRLDLLKKTIDQMPDPY